MLHNFFGLFTAVISPFINNKLDENSFVNLLSTQKNTDGIVIGGTTGESPTLEFDELLQLIDIAKLNYPGKILVGAGGNNTNACINKIKLLDGIEGIDGYLIVAPYYNKPNQRGIFEHFSAIAESTNRPIILYSIPGRCGIEIDVATVVQLATKYNNIVGIKEATDNCSRIDDMVRLLPKTFSILSGNDNITLPFMSLGAMGVISASSNVIPNEMQSLVDFCMHGDFMHARAIHKENILKMRALFMEPNPIAIKHILYKHGIIASAETRLPLCPSSEENLKFIESFFAK
jgi:4-hydroxy-tetrahydrodipicolinate synthase